MPGTGAALNPEWSILLAACSVLPPREKCKRLLTLLQQPVRWQALCALAEQHGTQPLLHQSLTEVADVVPGDELLSLNQRYEQNLHKALLLSRELIRIVDYLSGRGIEVVAYKGPAVAEVLYGDIALRQSGDIDLLIHSADLPRIRDAVRDLGYTPHQLLSGPEERAYLQSGYECAFDGTAGRNLLELQWAILPRFYAIDFDMRGVFDRAVNLSVAGRPMRTPSAADLLLILSAHAAKHVWGRLIWLCDIARLMQLPGLDWIWIQSQAKDLGIVRILRVTMLAANRLLGAAIPATASEFLSGDRSADAISKKVETFIVGPGSYDVESLAYFRLMMRLRERPADQIRFLTRLAFTTGPGEWNAIRLPGPLFPLYRMVRLFRLAGKLVGA
jgi:hypothetical protein